MTDEMLPESYHDEAVNIPVTCDGDVSFDKIQLLWSVAIPIAIPIATVIAIVTVVLLDHDPVTVIMVPAPVAVPIPIAHPNPNPPNPDVDALRNNHRFIGCD
jgi:hypothetical protein